MKKVLFYFTLLITCQLFCTEVAAQQSTYVRQPGYWTFGLNGGLAYQSSDVPIEWNGWGVGMTLAKNLYYQAGAPLSFDLRGRFLYNQSYGLGHSRSLGILNNNALNGQRPSGLDYTADGGGPGFVYDNYKTEMGELALEGVINFNRLREKTNVNLSIFGGIGLDLYHTKINQTDFSGDLYAQQYLDIDPRNPVSFKRSFLRDNILDDSYETDADGFENGAKLGFMPALGIELGYQFTPRFSMGIGHKLTFPLNDILDGQKWDNNNLATGNNDLHHYTNLHLRWIIEAGEKNLEPPLIQIIRPTSNPYTTRELYTQVAAKISRVQSAMDVTAVLNGGQTSFNFKKDYFTWSNELRPGRNELVITATNAAGRDQKKVILIFKDGIIDTPPPPPDADVRPEVDITNPPNRNYTSNRPSFDLRAQINHVSNKRQISLRVNGQEIYDFDYRPNQGTLQTTLSLEKGRNYVQITARTSGGTAEDDAIINYDRQNQGGNRPNVRITRPSSDPYRTSTERQIIEAQIDGVKNKSQITFRFNGRVQNNFSFSGRTLRAEVYLRSGTNDVEVEARNNAGSSRDSRQLILRDNNTPPAAAPTVEFLRPSQRSTTSDQVRYDIRARVRNVASARDIRFYLNGNRIQNFRFQNDILTHTISLRDGSNNVTIEASNRVGSDKESVTIRYSKVVVNTATPPQVTISRPSSTSTSSAQVALEAKVLNVQRKDQITLTLNGRVVGNFTYNSRSKLVNANLTLNKGQNTIVVKAVNNDGSDEDSHSIRFEQQSRPPQVSITKPSSSSTSNPEVRLEAKTLYVSTKSNVRITLNGQTVSNFSYNTKNKIATATLTLREGNNTIVVKGSNADGSDEDTHSIRYQRRSTPPQVTITRPSATSTSSATVSLEAKALNVSSKSNVRITLNGQTISNFNFNTQSKIATANLKLREGSNTIVVKGSNADGSDEDSHTIRYQRKSTPPQVTITRPTSNSTQNPVINLQAEIRNISSKREATLLLNGKQVTTFDYSTSTKLLRTSLKLRSGKNTIIVKAQNNDGSDQDTKVITYQAPSNPPQVSISQPANKSTVKSTSTTVKAQIKRVKGKSNVRFFVNGQEQSSFDFSGTSFSARANLRKGANTIRITAKNTDGSDEASITVYSQPPVVSVEKPTVKFTNPKVPGTTVAKRRLKVKASIRNIENKSQITFKLNGVKITSLNFDSATGMMTSGVDLKQGENTLEITAKNTGGSKTARTTVKYVPGDIGGNVAKPTISIVNVSEPTLDPFDPGKGSSLIEAKTTSITNKNQITFTVNGKASTAFTFNKASNRITATIQLKKGSNTFVIKVKNSAGSAEVSRTIQF